MENFSFCAVLVVFYAEKRTVTYSSTYMSSKPLNDLVKENTSSTSLSFV